MIFNCSEQLSGYAKIEIFLLEEVSNWPIVLNDTNSSQLIFNPSIYSVEASVIVDSIKVNYPKKQKPAGISHDITIKMDFSTRSESLEQYLEQYENKPVVVKGFLNNGFVKLFGSNLEPLFLIYEVDDGIKSEIEGLTSIEIKGETSKRPVYYTV